MIFYGLAAVMEAEPTSVHIVSQDELKRRIQAGAYATVETCDLDTDFIDSLDLPERCSLQSGPSESTNGSQIKCIPGEPAAVITGYETRHWDGARGFRGFRSEAVHR